MSIFLITSDTSHSSSYFIVLMGLGNPIPDLIHIYNCQISWNRTRDLMFNGQTRCLLYECGGLNNSNKKMIISNDCNRYIDWDDNILP